MGVLSGLNGSGEGEGRAGLEPRRGERREPCAGRPIPPRAFAAKALDLEILRLAGNRGTAFQRTGLPEDWQGLTLSTPRSR